MAPEEWVRSNFNIDRDFDAIAWGDGNYTVVANFLDMFGTTIKTALDAGKDPKRGIVESDPNNERGFNGYLQ